MTVALLAVPTRFCKYGGSAQSSLRIAFSLAAVWWLFTLAGCASSNPSLNGASGDDSPVALSNRGEESAQRRRARIRVELAVGYFQQGQSGVALDELKLALEADPSFPDAYNLLALVYFDLNEKARAEVSFRKALQLSPNDSEINNNFGWFLCQTGREALSLSYFENALKNPLYTTPEKPYTNAGLCALRINQFTTAENYLSQALARDPTSSVVLFQFATLCLKRGEYERGWFFINQLNTTSPPTAESLWLGIKLARKSGNADAELALAQQLRRRFASSREFGMLNRGAYDD